MREPSRPMVLKRGYCPTSSPWLALAPSSPKIPSASRSQRKSSGDTVVAEGIAASRRVSPSGTGRGTLITAVRLVPESKRTSVRTRDTRSRTYAFKLACTTTYRQAKAAQARDRATFAQERVALPTPTPPGDSCSSSSSSSTSSCRGRSLSLSLCLALMTAQRRYEATVLIFSPND